MTRLLRPLASAQTYRALAFYGATLGLGIAGFVLVLAGWPITLCLAITPLVVPLLIGLRAGVGALAAVEARLARDLLGAEVRAPMTTPGQGFWNRGFNVLRDQAFWKQQAHLVVSWPIALIPLTLLFWAFEAITLPIWYRWVDAYDVFGFIAVDRSVETLPVAAAGLALLAVVAHLLGPYTRVSRWVAARLLAGGDVELSPAERRARRLRALTIHALTAMSIVGTLIVIWALTTGGYFWPIWPLLSLALVVAIPGWVILVLERPEVSRLTLGSRALAIQIGISAVLVGFLVAVWTIDHVERHFWPIWPALGLALLAAVHAAVVYGRRQHRIERLESSRAGAVDVQETEFRRIERDLHDGAQACLVSLGMSLGMAEQKLQTDPEAVRELLVEARRGAGEALEELRVLARGIRPPILTDRGLEPAIAALTARTPLPVTLDVDAPDRYPAAVETAAYFTVAEALANAIKHGRATRVDIRIQAANGVLVAEVVDDGDGGADPAGPGLTGLRQRSEALDGTLSVASPVGGPTTVRAELPCGS